MNSTQSQSGSGHAEVVKWQFHKGTEFERFCAVWDEVNQASSGLPMLSASFVAFLLREFGAGNELIAVGYRGQTAHAVAVLKRERGGIYSTFQPSQAPLGIWIHRPPDTLESLAQGLLRQLPGFAVALGISQQDPDWVPRPAENPTTQTLDYIQTARVTVSVPFDKYWAERGKNLRNNTKRQRSRLEKDGVVLRLETIVDPAGVAQAIVDYGNLESAGWKAAGGTAIHPDNSQGRFYRALLEDCCRRGVGRIYRYWYGNSVAAVDLCVENEDTLVVLKTTYDESIRTSSPASLMRHEYFGRVFDEAKIRRIEFYGKVMDWHTKWTDEVRTLYHANFYRWPIIPKLRHWIRRQRSSVGHRPGKDEVPLGESADMSVGLQQESSVVTVYEEFPVLQERCNHLFSRTGDSGLFFTLSWYQNYVETVLNPDSRLRAYAVEIAGRPHGACALLCMQHVPPGKSRLLPHTLNSLGNYYTSLFGPIIDPAEPAVQRLLDLLAARIADDVFRWDMIDLHPLESPSPIFTALVVAFRRAGFVVHSYFCFGNWYLKVCGRSYSEYFEKLPSRVRNTIRKKRELVKESVASTILVYKDMSGVEEAVRDYEEVYAASWKSPEPYPDFIRGLCRACASMGWLRLGVMYIDKKPAAAQIWIVHAQVATIYKLAYDEHYAMYSPGTLLTAHLMEYVLDVDRVQEVDYLTGDEAYKKGWMSDRRERWGIVAFNPRTPLGLFALSVHLMGRAKRRTFEIAGQLRRTSSR